MTLYYNSIHVDGSFYKRSKFDDVSLLWSYNCAGSESSLLSCLNSYNYYDEYCYNGVKCYSKRIYRSKHKCTRTLMLFRLY